MTSRTRFPRLLALSLLLIVAAASVPSAGASSGNQPPRALDSRGLENLEAFTRLLGLVRFFHPSDAVAAMSPADWERFALAGVQRVEAAADRQELAAELTDLFAPLAPSVLLFPSESEPPVPDGGYPGPAPESGRRHVAWLHHGVELGPGTPYQSERIEVGRAPESSVFQASQTFLDALPLAGSDFELTLASRFSGSGSARVDVLVFTFSGFGFFTAPVTSATWAPVSVAGTMPPDAFLLFVSLTLQGAGTLEFDDLHLAAGGVDWTDRILSNPDLEERAVAGSWLLGWEPFSTPFGSYYEITSVTGGAAAGDWYARITGPRAWPVPTPHRALLGGGLSALLPLALLEEADGTVPPRPGDLPLPEPDKPPGFEPNAFDRASRLAGIALAWPVFTHFYPYFDDRSEGGDGDWDAALPAALTTAATDPDETAYRLTLRRLQAELHDGHARHDHPRVVPTVRFAFTWDWIEGALRITSVEAGATHGMAVGDRVLAVDGETAADALARIESLISSATPQYRRAVALHELASGFPGGTAELTVQPVAGGSPFTVEVPYTAPVGSVIGGLGSPEEPRPAEIEEVRPGIWYVDVTRIDAADFFGALGDLAAADGVVFDLRGYPWEAPFDVLYHLSDRPLTTANFEIPFVMRPSGRDWRWWDYGFVLPAYEPTIGGKMAWITDGRAISQSETWLGVVEAFGLGEIVGAPTAGTNGNINPFEIPGEFNLRWTGMRVRKHDGSRHHGVGIQPTVPVTRTLAGLLAGRDELLEKAIEVVSTP